VTLADLRRQERITLDLNLTFSDDSRHMSLDNMVVAELKHPCYVTKSPFFSMMKRLNVFPMKFSKYCMGIVFLEKEPRRNRFKKQLLALKKAGIVPEVSAWRRTSVIAAA